MTDRRPPADEPTETRAYEPGTRAYDATPADATATSAGAHRAAGEPVEDGIDDPAPTRRVDDRRVDDRSLDEEPVDEYPRAARYPSDTQEETDEALRVDGNRTLRENVVARERSEFGGMKFGAAFFGWLTATGMAVILTALVAAAGAAVGLGASGGSGNAAASEANKNAATIGVVGAIALVVIAFVAYYCGGYVAGRMSRFDGARQGLAVWIWAIIIAVVVAILTLILGAQYNILGSINGFPRIPLDEGTVTATGIITAVAVAIVSLAGAVLGGVAGMRYHRRVDRVGLGS
ncbi:hypothetical protein ACFRFH_19435 [Leifsonia sp. NPDC056824]|uniref:hypothetical protein n=1 Tax=Leifsonia sp. NPDC056824 TaxID=3345953 RepID=UPI0036B1AEE2